MSEHVSQSGMHLKERTLRFENVRYLSFPALTENVFPIFTPRLYFVDRSLLFVSLSSAKNRSFVKWV